MPATKTVKAPNAPAKKSRVAAVKPAAKASLPKATKPAPRPAAKPARAPAVQDAARAPKPPKKAPKVWARMVRDSFTMPEADFALIAALKARALAGQRETKKSELLRAGLHALVALDSPALLKALGELEPVKIGRPKKGHGHA